MTDDAKMREFVRAEVELILMERSLGWGRFAVLLGTLVPIISLVDDARPQVVLAGTVCALVQWAAYFARRRAYQKALDHREARFGERDRLIGTMARRQA